EMGREAGASLRGVGPRALVGNVTAFLRSTHASVSTINGIVDIGFKNAGTVAHPLTSPDGKKWSAVPQLRTLELPAGRTVGWFRDSDGSVHVLTTHLAYFALVG